MIRYDLKCAEGHEYDSWFGSSEDFAKLKSAGMICCAICGGTDVEKAVMAPRVRTSENARPLSGKKSAAEQALSELRTKIESSAENVGENFPTEARKMHYGDAPERAIIGEAKPEEARALIEEGVPVTPLPWGNRKTN
ncbi:MAG TPA: DUF1178 family protein [Paracoccaceae bacterium]|nr:DUF1178 family protein [Paracoccaceae bacterium]